jgi:hypothetical protein
MYYYKWRGDKNRISKRAELCDSEHQTVLAMVAEEHSWVICGCREDRVLRLKPYALTPVLRSLRRESMSDEHIEGCPFYGIVQSINVERPVSEQVIYTENSLFGLIPSATGKSGTVSGAVPGANPNRYEDLTHFIQAQFTRAYLEAFRDANGGLSFDSPNLRNPTQAAVFARMYKLFFEPIVNGGLLSFIAALQLNDLEFIWGVTSQALVQAVEEPLGEDEILEFQLGSHWSSKGFSPLNRVIEIGPDIASNASGKVLAMGHRIEGPYLYAVLMPNVGNSRMARYLYRVPVWSNGDQIDLIESEAERRCAGTFKAAKLPSLKLHVEGDLSILGKLWPLPTDSLGHLSSRPDFIIFARGLIWILFVTHTSEANYHESVDESVVRMEKFIVSHLARVRKVSAEQIENGNLDTVLN